ncbi:LPS-assembly protein LptD [Albidovulum sp.]|uniref:LPS-assembly protein LptD n=1 Tax=Albidovulum sp. TaxID=1872424 RepID=UPI0039B97A9C
MRRLLLCLLLWLAALPARAQDEPATLVADRVFLTAGDTLTAEGAVEVFYRGARLAARRIVYDGATAELTIEGPITLTDGAGTVILADQAELSRDLTEGVLRSARMVLDEQLQIAADEIARTSGRFTRASRVVASSCQVCPSNPTPLWEIRARRVLHDQVERQLYFDHAQFRVAGLPVFYVPRLRMPDPTLKRATGFLMPRFRTTTALGPGLKLPYFIAIGDSRDLTLTPYVSASRTRTLEFRYREAYPTGAIEVAGAFTRDDLISGETRGYVFAEGAFALPRDFRLAFSLQEVSDDAYILDYGLDETDLLESGVELARTRRNEHIEAAIFRYWSIRAGDDNAVLPTIVGDFSITRRFSPRIIGGEAQFEFDLHSHRRSSDVATDANGDGTVDGRDVARASAVADWRRSWILPNGMVLAGAAEVAADFYSIGQDASYPGTVTRILPAAAVELRWPWVKAATRTGAAHVIEPVAQLVLAPDSAEAVPNEDSQIVNFDEGNLFAFSRFPGADARELGSRLNLGMSWTRLDPAGWSLGVTAGRVFRAGDRGQFSAASGLDGTVSDWLVAAQLTTAAGLDVMNRMTFDDDLDVSREELIIGYATPRLDLSAGYLWLVADPAENRALPTSELIIDAGWDIGRSWRGSLTGRYDFEAERATRAALGLAWRTDCATVDLSLSRRFTSSTSVKADTDINLSVILHGIGAGGDGRHYRRSCGP